MQNPRIIRTGIYLETGDYGYGAVIQTDRAEEIPDSYLLALLEWAKNVWDWEAVVTEEENRAEDLELEGEHVCYNLSTEDLIGLFGGKYGGSPGAIPGFVDMAYKEKYAKDTIADDWSDIVAYVYIPPGRFSPEVIAELNEVD